MSTPAEVRKPRRRWLIPLAVSLTLVGAVTAMLASEIGKSRRAIWASVAT